VVRSTATFDPTVGDPSELNFANPVVVLRGPFRVAFSYAGPDRVWQDSWRGKPQLPRAIRLQVRDAATSRILTASTATLVHAELSARCAMMLNRLDLAESSLGSNAGAAKLRTECLGAATGSGGTPVDAGATGGE
jgi:hypothetical protein